MKSEPLCPEFAEWLAMSQRAMRADYSLDDGEATANPLAHEGHSHPEDGCKACQKLSSAEAVAYIERAWKLLDWKTATDRERLGLDAYWRGGHPTFDFPTWRVRARPWDWAWD